MTVVLIGPLWRFHASIKEHVNIKEGTVEFRGLESEGFGLVEVSRFFGVLWFGFQKFCGASSEVDGMSAVEDMASQNGNHP